MWICFITTLHNFILYSQTILHKFSLFLFDIFEIASAFLRIFGLKIRLFLRDKCKCECKWYRLASISTSSNRKINSYATGWVDSLLPEQEWGRVVSRILGKPRPDRRIYPVADRTGVKDFCRYNIWLKCQQEVASCKRTGAVSCGAAASVDERRAISLHPRSLRSITQFENALFAKRASQFLGTLRWILIYARRRKYFTFFPREFIEKSIQMKNNVWFNSVAYFVWE